MQFQGSTSGTANTPRRIFQRAGAGSLTLTIASQTITGTGTSFVVDFRIGDYILANSQIFKIVNIISATEMIVDIQASANASSVSYSWMPKMSKTGKVDSIEVINKASSTPIYIGTSTNVTLDGSDVTTTFQSVMIPAGKSMLLREVDYHNVYSLATSTNIPYHINKLEY
jgi:hypothetical protein